MGIKKVYILIIVIHLPVGRTLLGSKHNLDYNEKERPEVSLADDKFENRFELEDYR